MSNTILKNQRFKAWYKFLVEFNKILTQQNSFNSAKFLMTHESNLHESTSKEEKKNNNIILIKIIKLKSWEKINNNKKKSPKNWEN
jgi:hypothetical protein